MTDSTNTPKPEKDTVSANVRYIIRGLLLVAWIGSLAALAITKSDYLNDFFWGGLVLFAWGFFDK